MNEFLKVNDINNNGSIKNKNGQNKSENVVRTLLSKYDKLK
jgi:hypothetical protein